MAVHPGRPYNRMSDYNKDTYYLKEGAHLEFIGKGAEDLGLMNLQMTDELYHNLASGKGLDGSPLTRSAAEAEDGKKHRTGFDLPFSPDKSVSLAHFYGDEEQKKAILDAHNNAVRSCAEYIEQNLVQFRKSGGKVYETSQTMVASHINHFISRDKDPQLHSHLVIYNLTQDKNGNWYSLDGDMLYNTKLLTEMYNTELAMGLKEKGFDTMWVKTGTTTAVRIEGVSEEAMEVHSKRKTSIKAMENNPDFQKMIQDKYAGATKSEIRKIAVLETRKFKEIADMVLIEKNCRADLLKAGIDPESMKSIRTPGIKIEPLELREQKAKDFISLAIKHITEREMVFTKNDVLTHALDFARDKCGKKDLEKAFEMNDDLYKIGILTDRKHGGTSKEYRYSTKELANEERFAVELTWQYNREDKVIIDKESIKRHIKVFEQEEKERLIAEYGNTDYKGLTKGQKEAVIELLSGKRMSAIQGDPGVGKTTLVKTARRVLEMAGSEYKIIGLAPTGQAAKELNKAAGVEANTVDSFLLKKKVDLEKKIVIIDETSMLGINKMAALQRLLMDHDIKECVIGDIKQMQSVDAGNYFGLIQTNKSFFKNIVKMEDRVRQKSEDYIKLVERVINADSETTFRFMKEKEMLKEEKDPVKRMKAAAEEFIKDPDKSLIVVARNKEARELNDYIRERIRQDILPDGSRKLGEDHHLPTFQKDNITKAEASLAHKYDEEKRLVLFQDIGNKYKKGSVLSVVKTDVIENKILVRDVKSGKETWIDPKKEVDKYQVYKETIQPFSKGDTIIFQNNDKKLGVVNGLFGRVTQFDGKNFSVDVGKGNNKVFNIAEYPFITHGYAVTTEKSQGASIPANITLWSFKNKGMNTRNSMIVGLTRGIDGCKTFVDNAENLAQQFDQWRRKSSTMDTEKRVEIESNTQKITKGLTPDRIKKQHEREMGI